jgi:hypothetical protein
LNEPATQILNGDLTSVTYDEVTEVLENRHGDYYLEQAFRDQWKRRIQHSGESLRKFTAVIDHLSHHAHVQLPKPLISNETARFTGFLLDGSAHSKKKWIHRVLTHFFISKWHKNIRYSLL